uniref:Uncharacterized protein n=1 Tax=Anguilla anguilla TaxID=7936 RepID=A0A0E9RBB5_ANGAN
MSPFVMFFLDFQLRLSQNLNRTGVLELTQPYLRILDC